MYNAQRRGDSWKLNDLRALLFGHYARESKATSGPLAIEGFSRQSVKKKLQKMQKVLGDDVMNFPWLATQVLRFDPRTQQATLVGDQLMGIQKWSGGVLHIVAF